MATTLKTLAAWEKRLSREQKALDRRERWLRADQRWLQARWERLSAKRQALLGTLPPGPHQITGIALALLHQKLNFIASMNRVGADTEPASAQPVSPMSIGTSLRIRLPVVYTVKTADPSQ